jgi:hypothetical protein
VDIIFSDVYTASEFRTEVLIPTYQTTRYHKLRDIIYFNTASRITLLVLCLKTSSKMDGKKGKAIPVTGRGGLIGL